MPRLLGTVCQRQCGSFVMKLRRLDANEGKEIVHWHGTQASGHSSQGIVKDRVKGMNTAALGRNAVLC